MQELNVIKGKTVEEAKIVGRILRLVFTDGSKADIEAYLDNDCGVITIHMKLRVFEQTSGNVATKTGL
jgi:hypothetical protein